MAQIEKISDVEVAYVVSLKETSGLGWPEITGRYNTKFRKDRSVDSVKHIYHRNRDRLSDTNEYVKLFRDVANTRKANSLNSKVLKKVTEEWDKREDILGAIKGAAKDLNKLFSKPIRLPKPSKGKKSMTLELLISDVHVGKLTETFNNEVLKRRLKQLANTTIKEMRRASEHYKIDRIILAFLGDLIENYEMHGLESARGCEFGNSRQVQECLTQMFHLVFAPICAVAAQLGAKIDAVGITGNHDRTNQEKTFNNPGEENLTFIIYKAMEEFSNLANIKNVTWHIPIDPYQYIEIYGEGVLYEHLDNVKGNNLRTGVENLIAKRTNQLKKPIVFARGGHFHSPFESGIGKIIVNGNVPGNDGYSTVLGFDCEPSQTLNFYIEREKNDSVKRMTSFYKKLIIQLD